MTLPHQFQGLPDHMTLGDARQWLRDRVDNGDRCPACTQFAKVYRRKLNSGMANALVRMYAKCHTDWGHKPTVMRGIGAAARDESLLRHWELMEEDPDRAGWWRVTPAGEQFVLDQSTVQSHVVLYDNRFRGFEGAQVSIRKCLGSRFDYAELMRAVAP